jgi:hypothetical protein
MAHQTRFGTSDDIPSHGDGTSSAEDQAREVENSPPPVATGTFETRFWPLTLARMGIPTVVGLATKERCRGLMDRPRPANHSPPPPFFATETNETAGSAAVKYSSGFPVRPLPYAERRDCVIRAHPRLSPVGCHKKQPLALPTKLPAASGFLTRLGHRTACASIIGRTELPRPILGASAIEKDAPAGRREPLLAVGRGK